MLFHEIPHSFAVTTPPAAEPLAAADLRAQLRIDSTAEDSLIAEYIQTAREMIELDARRALVTQTQTLYADQFPYWGMLDRQSIERTSQATGVFYGGGLELRRPPLAYVSSIAYTDTAGDAQTLDAANYLVDAVTEPPRVFPAYGLPWPLTRWQANAVRVAFVAGYATPFTANATTNVITLQGRTVADGDAFQLSNAGGALPAGLTAGPVYYVRDSTGTTCKLAATAGGSAIDITDTGTGTQFLGQVPKRALQAIRLLVAHWYRNREAVGSMTSEIAFAYTRLIRSLLWTLPV